MLVACYLIHGVAAALVTNGGIPSSVYQALILFSHLRRAFLNSSLIPILLLLETRRQTSREGHDQTKCFANFKTSLDLHNEKMKVELNRLTHLVVQIKCKLFLYAISRFSRYAYYKTGLYPLLVYFTWLLELTYKFTG